MLRFVDGCDHYPQAGLLEKWTNAVNATVQAGAGRFGGNAIKILEASAGGTLVKTLDAHNVWIVGFAVYFTGLPTSSAVIVKFLDQGQVQLDLRLYADGTMALTRNGAALAGGRSAVAVGLATWHHVEVKVKFADTSVGNTCKVVLDGVEILNVTAAEDTKETGNTTANAIGFAGAAPNALFDDFVICDDAGAQCNDVLGDTRIHTLYPNGAGDSTQFGVVGAANNWSAAANNPSLGDTQYVYSATAGQVDLYDLTNPGLGADALGIQVVTRCRKDDAGARTLAATYSSGGTPVVGSTFSPTTTWRYYTAIATLEPNSLLPFTGSDIDALQAGLKVVS
jgi:hypothetical protein